MNKIVLGNVKHVRVVKPHLVSDCAYKDDPGRSCVTDGIPCSKDLCHKWSDIKIEIGQLHDFDDVFTDIVLHVDRADYERDPLQIVGD